MKHTPDRKVVFRTYKLMMLSALSDEDKKTILRAAEILRNIGG
jgi:hypothetical protein